MGIVNNFRKGQADLDQQKKFDLQKNIDQMIDHDEEQERKRQEYLKSDEHKQWMAFLSRLQPYANMGYTKRKQK